MQVRALLYLRGDTHAARNVHTENHHGVLHILVVVIVLSLQVEVIAHACMVNSVCACAAVGHLLFTITEFTFPCLLQKEEKSCGLLFKYDTTFQDEEKNKTRFVEKPQHLQGNEV